MKNTLKTADRALQLGLLILIGVCAISIYGWMFLMVLFPALAVLQLLSAGIRTIFEFKKTDWHQHTFNTYWILVGCWIVINTIVYLIPAINDVFYLTMMVLSLPIAIWYYAQISKEKSAIRRVVGKEEIAENARLAAMVK